MKIFKFITLTLLTISMADTYKQPSYNLIKKDNNIEIREYSQYVIAKTIIDEGSLDEDNNMFRKLGGYIFGNNDKNASIPMTAPVITQSTSAGYEMIFFMLSVDSPDQLPRPTNDAVLLETMEIGKAISISFGMWATEARVASYKKILDQYIKENNIEVDSNLMVAQYNSPWALPPFRKNELIYKIK